MNETVLIAIVSGLIALMTATLTTLIVQEIQRRSRLDELSARKEEISATAAQKVSEAAALILNEFQEECVALRELVVKLRVRVETLEKDNSRLVDRVIALEKENVDLRSKLKSAEVKLEHAGNLVDIALEWMSEYTPALKKAGIEPLDVNKLQFRGGVE